MSVSRTIVVNLALVAALACNKREPPGPTPAPIAPSTATAAKPATAAQAAPPSGIPSPPPSPVSSPSPSPVPSPSTLGCGAAKPSPRGASFTTKSGRTFHVWGPSTYDGARGYPIVLTFHGWYANGRAFQKWFKMEEHVEGSAFTVYPDSKGPTWDLTGDQDLDFAEQLVDALASSYCIDRKRVFALGFSFGGKLVHHLGCKRPGLVRAIAVGDGSWQRESGCRAPVPVLVTHRTRDHDELIAWGKDAARRWAKHNGCSTASDSIDAAHGCVAYRGCTSPGSVTFCEDTHFDSSWPKDWNHTVREEYRSLTWRWFMGVP